MTNYTHLGKQINDLVKAVRGLKPQPGAGVLISATTGGVARRTVWRPRRAAVCKLTRYRIETLADDFFTAYPADEDGAAISGAGLVAIAKPEHCRKSAFDGQTIDGWDYTFTDHNHRTRDLNGASGFSTNATLAESLQPPYAVGDSIYALPTSVNTGVLDASSDPIKHLEVVPGRQWLPKPSELALCVMVNGVKTDKRIVVLGGPTFDPP